MTDYRRVRQILAACRLFSSLEPDQLDSIARIGRLRLADGGERLFDQGQPCAGMFVVGGGRVKVFKSSPEGKEHILHMVQAGETFAEAAMFGGFDYPASAQAIADSEIVFLPREPFIRLLTEHPAVAVRLLAGMSLWLRRMVDLMEDIVLRDAAGRLAKYILSLAPGSDAAVAVPMKHQELAAHLGMTRETVSRTMAHLEERNLISLLPKGRIRVKNRRGLAELAGQILPGAEH